MNRMVMVINSDRRYSSNNLPYPPVGAIGEIISSFDEDGECDVVFDEHPCLTTPFDPSWITHRSMIVFIGNEEEARKEEEALCA